MKQAQVLKIVVASPGDVQAARDMIPAIVDELNKGIADERGVRLEVFRWETDAYPGFHPEGPQGQIDSSLRIDDCDILIGIFWKRFGTPVLDAQSGTEHDIRLALEPCEKLGRPQLMPLMMKMESLVCWKKRAKKMKHKVEVVVKTLKCEYYAQ